MAENGVFSEQGRRLLLENVDRMSKVNLCLYAYACEPYTVLIVLTTNKMFLMETHPILFALGENGQGLLKVYADKEYINCHFSIQLR